MIEWRIRTIDELTTRELYAICAARESVFVVEQTCAYQDLDGYDLDAEHVIAWADGAVAAYSRILEPNTKFSEPSIGRVLTTAAHRGTGIGRELMERSLARTTERFPVAAIRIGAQERLRRFYESLGFAQASDTYLEDGIAHIEMVRTPE